MLNPSLEQQFSTALRTRLYAAIVSARWSFLVGRRSTDLVHATTAEIDRISTAAYQLLTLLSGLAVTAVYAAIALRLSFWLTILVALAGAAPALDVPGRTPRSADSGAAIAERQPRPVSHGVGVHCGAQGCQERRRRERDIAIFAGLARTRQTAISPCCDRLPRPRCDWTCRARSSSAFFSLSPSKASSCVAPGCW